MKVNIIYADPPWRYNDRKKIRKDGKMAKRGIGASTIYDCMSTEELCKIDITSMTDENCALFLWATFPMLQDAIQVMEAWGFRYITSGFTWVKTSKNGKPFFGCGYYTKSNAEICLLGIKGRMKPVSNSVSQIILGPHPRDEHGKIIHSRKPDSVRKKIVELFGDLPRIELFAREKTEGWLAFGNEIESDIAINTKI